jgi:hypothetical protein
MSLGFCGQCVLLEETDKTVAYTYSGENWNEPDKKSGKELQDGLLEIHKSAFCGLTKANYKATYIDKVYRAIEKGDIEIIIECKNAFHRGEEPIDYIAMRLILHIFECYGRNGKLPNNEAFIQ